MSCDHKDQVKTSRYVNGILETTCRDCEPEKKPKIYVIKKGGGWGGKD